MKLHKFAHVNGGMRNPDKHAQTGSEDPNGENGILRYTDVIISRPEYSQMEGLIKAVA